MESPKNEGERLPVEGTSDLSAGLGGDELPPGKEITWVGIDAGGCTNPTPCLPVSQSWPDWGEAHKHTALGDIPELFPAASNRGVLVDYVDFNGVAVPQFRPMTPEEMDRRDAKDPCA